jgi:hypothetical protein
MQGLLVPKVKRVIKVKRVRVDCRGQPVMKDHVGHRVQQDQPVMKDHVDRKVCQDLRDLPAQAASWSTLAMEQAKSPVAISHFMLFSRPLPMSRRKLNMMLNMMLKLKFQATSNNSALVS